MSIVLTRIDNRLLHGIVASQWAPASGTNRLMVIDDDVANDEMSKSAMKLARPVGMALSIITEEKAIANFTNQKYNMEKVFIVVKDVKILARLQEKGVEISKVNIGGTVSREGAIKLSKRACATEDEITNYKKMMNNGTKVSIQYILADNEVDLSTMID